MNGDFTFKPEYRHLQVRGYVQHEQNQENVRAPRPITRADLWLEYHGEGDSRNKKGVQVNTTDWSATQTVRDSATEMAGGEVTEEEWIDAMELLHDAELASSQIPESDSPDADALTAASASESSCSRAERSAGSALSPALSVSGSSSGLTSLWWCNEASFQKRIGEPIVKMLQAHGRCTEEYAAQSVVNAGYARGVKVFRTDQNVFYIGSAKKDNYKDKEHCVSQGLDGSWQCSCSQKRSAGCHHRVGVWAMLVCLGNCPFFCCAYHT